MSSYSLTVMFVAALVASVLVKFWLASRQIRHVRAHRNAVPAPFDQSISLEAHQKAADYTLAKARFGLMTVAFSSAVLIGWTLLGGLDVLNEFVRTVVQPRWGSLAYEVALVVAFSFIGSAIELPLDLYGIFVIEQKFGFNRMTLKLYLIDMVKHTIQGLILFVPLATLILWLMGVAGPYWWLWAWAAFAGFVALMQVIYPVFFAPWFNKFEPLTDSSLESRVRALMSKCRVAVKDFFVMDGSKRSAHANAYFTGFGASRRVVFYDTLLNKLSAGEIEAVLAHELGHFKHRHIQKGVAMMLVLSLLAFALLGWLSTQAWFYAAFGVRPSMTAPNDAVALLLLMLVVPVFGFFVTPLFAQFSRKHEFEADAYACAQADGHALATALLKLNEGNAATLTPDPLYVRFYYSHPPASERLAALPLTPSHQAG